MVEMDDLRRWVVKNKLKTVVYTWLAGVTGSLAFQWTRPIPTSLK